MTTTPSKQSANGAEPGHSAGSRRHRRGFGVVAFAFLVVMALGTVSSPLYGVYRARDHFSLFMVTVAFAVYAVGVIVALPGARCPIPHAAPRPRRTKPSLRTGRRSGPHLSRTV